MPKELKNYRFTSDFVEGIERFYWNNKLSAFILVEETIPVVMLLGDSWSHRRKGLTWLEYTSKDVETPNLHDASVMFKFRTVFQNLYRFENLSSPFFNDPMRLKSVDYLKRLEGTLSTIQRDMNKRITSYSSIIDRIFSSLPGYLVCIHGLNEIIRPSSSMHERPVVQQEQALEFFIELNSELAESYRNSLQRKVNLVMSDVRWVDLEFKERKRQLSYKVVNSIQVQPDYLAWVYVELWLITHRPNFYKFYADLACAEESRKISKFKSSFNKLLFILFSGVVKSQQH
ncbi:hypothetical protein BY996DRAFT_6973570 [Phakopsora pachyrhizi]|nr:hypothetical protein BY996DRAFT_6973570 [Phakopsora pachyrhizi]